MQLYPFILQTVTGLSGSEARRYSPPANVLTVSAMIMVDKCKEARRGRYYLFDKKAEVHNLTREPKPQYVVIIYELKVIWSLTYELSYIRAHKDISAGGGCRLSMRLVEEIATSRLAPGDPHSPTCTQQVFANAPHAPPQRDPPL